MYNVIVINVDELWLKGKNRPLYFRAIREHIQELLKAYHPHRFRCEHEEQRIIAESDEPFSEDVMQALLKVPGIHSILPSRRVGVSFDEAKEAVLEELKGLDFLSAVRTFKVETRRSDKLFPMTSMDFSSNMGDAILTVYPHLKVAMKGAELVIETRILKNNIFIATRKLFGVGGLPTGTSGHLISLISGGFDSPVASYLMAKRGCRQTFIFFYAYPFVGDQVKEKIFKLVGLLGQYQRHSRLFVVPFGDVQNMIAKMCLPDYRTLLFRKAMVQCATLLSKRVRGDGLLTGDALGQVSSQTIKNISVLDHATPLTIFRPLIGFNKIEIIELSKKIGTHDISVIPHDDACSLFAPKHPIIKPDTDYIAEYDSESAASLDEALHKCLSEAEVFNISITGEMTEYKKEIS